MSDDIENDDWRCGCQHSNPDFDKRCNGCSEERYPEEEDVPVPRYVANYRACRCGHTHAGHYRLSEECPWYPAKCDCKKYEASPEAKPDLTAIFGRPNQGRLWLLGGPDV